MAVNAVQLHYEEKAWSNIDVVLIMNVKNITKRAWESLNVNRNNKRKQSNTQKNS